MIQYNFLNSFLLKNANTILLQSKMPSSDMTKFRSIYKKAKNVVILTGAGVSAESGVPTFRGAGGMWRNYQASKLATPEAFDDNPSLVWEFYHYRREVVATKLPNKAHKAISDAQKLLKSEGRELTLITQNVDELHTIAGTEGVLELHGSLFRTKCISCRNRQPNRDSPICEALRGKGDPNLEHSAAEVQEEDLPHCVNCKSLLRPDIVWFGENLNDDVLDAALAAAYNCDLFLIVGTSSVVAPASMFAPTVSNRGVPVAEFNIEKTPITKDNEFYFEGPCGETLPIALAP